MGHILCKILSTSRSISQCLHDHNEFNTNLQVSDLIVRLAYYHLLWVFIIFETMIRRATLRWKWQSSNRVFLFKCLVLLKLKKWAENDHVFWKVQYSYTDSFNFDKEGSLIGKSKLKMMTANNSLLYWSILTRSAKSIWSTPVESR